MTLLNIWLKELKLKPRTRISATSMHGIWPHRDPADTAEYLSKATDTAFIVDEDGGYVFTRKHEGKEPE